LYDCEIPMTHPKVLLLAYAVSPQRGSEYSVAWNHITWMSKYCELTVLYGCAGTHMGDFEELADPVLRESLPSVNFVPVPPPLLARLLNAVNRRGWLTYSFYLAYRVWQREAGRVARQLAREQVYDLIHYVGPIGYREPGTMWRMDLPYVWGPIGGATHLPWMLARALPLADRVRLGLRAVANWFQLRFSKRVRRALSRADLVLTATTENQAIFRRVLGVESLYLPENGVVGEVALNQAKFDDLQRLKLVWIGSLEARKALKILVDAMQRTQHAARFEVHVAGDGPLGTVLQKTVASAGLAAQFVWHGQVERQTVHHLLNDSHLHVITSVSEANTTVVWEAMALGVPTLTIDHCGMHDTITDGAGLKVPIGQYDEVVAGFARHLDELAEHPERLRQMAQQVLADADRFHWKHRPAFWLKCYADTVARHGERGGAAPESRRWQQ
jgi:glycosyltransferase involved in cell wall biosynthesis